MSLSPLQIGFLSRCRMLFCCLALQYQSLIKIDMDTQDNTTIASEQETSANAGQLITPFLWFDGRLEEAANFYTSVFENAEIVHMAYLPADAPGMTRKASMATFRLNGVEF